MEPRFSSLATALEGTQALAPLLILLLNNLLCNPVKMITSQIKNFFHREDLHLYHQASGS